MRKILPWAAALAVATAGCIPSSDQAPNGAPAAPAVAPAPPDTAATDAPAPPAAAEGEQPGLTTFEPEALYGEWEGLANDALANLSNPRAVELGVLLQTLGPDALDPLIAVLGDPAAPAEKKVFVVVTLQSIVDPTLTPKLIPLTDASHDDVTRSSAAQLISQAQDPATQDLLRALSEDENEKVRLAALQGLALMNVPEALARLRAMYTEEGVQPSIRDRIVQTVARFPQEESLAVYRAAATDPLLEPASRFGAVVGLGSVGEEADLALLEEAGALGGDEDFMNMVAIAKGQIESRLAGESESAASETPEAPAAP